MDKLLDGANKMKKLRWCIILIGVVGCTLWCMQPADRNEGQQEVMKANVNAEEVIQEPVQEPVQDPIDIYIEDLSLEEKIGQLFIVSLNDQVENKMLIEQCNVGGVVLFKKDIISKEQVQVLVKALQDVAKIPLWIAIDEEGGRVSRVGSQPQIVKEPFKSAYEIGQTKDEDLAYKEAKKMGKVLAGLGINMDFAPVADIYNNENNTVIGDRSFGHTKEEVTPMVIAFARGLREEGIFPVIKHFPGHGNTYQDTHEQLAYINKSLRELENEEFVPFKKATEQGVEGMMVGHLVVTEVDHLPATLSPKWGDYIKQHFEEENLLLITDAMNMGAIVQNKAAGVAAVESFLSGMDIILMPNDVEAAEEAMKKAYEEGQITAERLNESVKKILLKKVEQNLLVLE